VIEARGNPRSPVLVSVGEGKVWLACSMDGPSGRKIVVKRKKL